jgi:ribosomal protein S18 acetylase RimI-like enzyme
MFSIRRAEKNDADVLATLGERLFRAAFGASNTAEDMQLYVQFAFSVKRQSLELSNPSIGTWLVEDRVGDSIGYAMVKLGAPSHDIEARNPLEIVRFYVDAAWHGQGIAAALMATCVDQARDWGCDQLWLGVWDQNPRAIAFYKKSGFRIVGSQPFQLGADRQRDFIMVRPVDLQEDFQEGQSR